MRIGIRILSFLLPVMAVFSTASPVAHAQPAPSVNKPPHAELALSYAYLRSNAPPGDCGCFNLNGGSATIALPLHRSRFAVAGDIGVSHANGISSGNYSLTLSTYTAGLRYQPVFRRSIVQPFGQVLAGVAHASGSLVDSQNSSASFAALAGGGLDLKLSPHFSFRLLEADYLVTTRNNGVNDHQNNLRLNSGIVLRF